MNSEPDWIFYTKVLRRALNELESACTAEPESKEYTFYRAEAPVVLEEAREALAALQRHVRHLNARHPRPLDPPTQH